MKKVLLGLLLMVGIGNSWMFNPRFSFEIGKHNGQHEQYYSGLGVGVNFKYPSKSLNRYFIGVGFIEGKIEKEWYDDNSGFIGYKYHGKFIEFGYERMLNDNWSIGLHESLIRSDYFVGLGRKRSSSTLVGDYMNDEYFVAKTDLSILYKYFGVAIGLDTELSFGCKLFVQIGK